MRKPGQPKRITVAIVGRWLVCLMDYCLLALGVMGSATGFILVALGVHHEYSPAIVIVGTIFLVGFLAMIFAWSISHRLMVLTTMERQTNEMLEELLRRTER